MKRIKSLYLAFSLAFTAWFIASWVNVCATNLTTNSIAEWNLLSIIILCLPQQSNSHALMK